MNFYRLDKLDNHIVNLLLEDGRMSYSDMAEKVGVSRTAVKNRVKKLEERGIIKGYKAVINTKTSPEMITFVTVIETEAAHFEECKRIFAESEETVTAIQTTGNCRLIAICLAPDISKMRDFITRIYRSVPGIKSVSTNSVLDVVKGSITPEK